MRNAETVLGVLRERGRRHWPLERVYRLLFNPELYLLAYGRIYSNKGAMTPGVTGETADGMCPFRGVRCLRVYSASGTAGSQGLPASAELTASRAVRPCAMAESR